jgi:hypothetical protein
MKLGQLYMLIGSSFLEPHLSPAVGVGAAAVYMALGLWLGFKQREAA